MDAWSWAWDESEGALREVVDRTESAAVFRNESDATRTKGPVWRREEMLWLDTQCGVRGIVWQ